MLVICQTVSEGKIKSTAPQVTLEVKKKKKNTWAGGKSFGPQTEQTPARYYGRRRLIMFSHQKKVTTALVFAK